MISLTSSWPLETCRCARVRNEPKVARSDPAAWVGELYDLYVDDVFGLALWILGSQDEAADAVQDAFVRLLTWRGSFTEIRNPRAFLLRLGRTAALDRVRKHKPTEPLLEQTLLAPARDDPETKARAREVSRALSRLSAKQREAVYLRFFLGLTFKEIGRVARVPTFTAASRCRLGMRQLAKRMNDR